MIRDESRHEYPIGIQERSGYGNLRTRDILVIYRGEEIVIRWTCGDVIGGWTVEQFEALLKQIAKVPVSKGLILPLDVYDDTYGVMLADDGTVLYGDSVGHITNQGPSLPELKKALASIKRYIKKEAAQADKEVVGV